MKPLSSLFVILILFQSLFLGNLVKLELPDIAAQNWDVTQLHKTVVLDPFLLPGKDGFDQNAQNKNEWVPLHFNKVFLLINTRILPVCSKTQFTQEIRRKFKPIPVFILNSTLRI